jgi:hypothetical protein
MAYRRWQRHRQNFYPLSSVLIDFFCIAGVNDAGDGTVATAEPGGIAVTAGLVPYQIREKLLR